jgi:hemerythrin
MGRLGGHMSLYLWSKKYSVGIDLLDEHHQRIVFILNRLDEALSARRDDDIVGHIIEELACLAAEHLKAEERLMHEIRYPEMEGHRAMHRFFAAEAALLRSMHASGKNLRVQGIAHFLRDWFVYHVYSEDRKYAEYLEQPQASAV